MKAFFITFPGAWFEGWAIVVAPNREAALFYVKNKRETMANKPYDKNFLTGTIQDSDFKVIEINMFKEGVQFYDSGDD